MNSYLLSKKIRHTFGEAVDDFRMIQEGDSLLVGFSGGKDSLLLLLALEQLRKKSPVFFEIRAAIINATDKEIDFSPWNDLFKKINIFPDIITYPIFDILHIRNERSPCSLCAHIRRGLLAKQALKTGCNAIALGHHCDDVIETFLLNLLYTGRIKVFNPNLYMSRTQIKVIRPMVYISENRVSEEIKRLNLPILDPKCPFACQNKRNEIKNVLAQLSIQFPQLKSNILHALRHYHEEDMWNI